MYNPHIHYRSSFRIEKAGLISKESVFQIVVGKLGNWLKTHPQLLDVSQDIFKSWLYTGGNAYSRGGAVIEVQTDSYNTERRWAGKWVLRLEHADTEHRQRRWRTDIALTCESEESAVFSVTVTRYLRPDYLGEEPGAPDSSVPRFVREIIGDKRIKSLSGDTRLISNAHNLMPGDGRAFFQAIISPERILPIVVINIRDFSGKLSADGLQNIILGSGIVYWYDNGDIHQEIDYEWGRLLSELYQCSPDTIRVYLPGVSTQKAFDWKRHRFFLLNKFQGNEQGLIRIISQSVFRIMTHHIQDGRITDLESLDTYRHKQRLSKLKEAASDSTISKEQNEYLLALEEENVQVSTQMKGLQAELNNKQQQSDFLELQVDDLQMQLNDMQEQFSQFAITEQQYKKVLRDQDEKRGFAQNLPTTLAQVLRFIAHIFPDKITVLESAYESAEASKFQFIPDANKLLYSIATDLHSILFIEKEGDIEGAFKRSGYELTLKESSATKADKRLMALRKRVYDGQEEDFSAHAKFNKNNRDIRIHFFVDQKRRLIVIGHFGDHLETAGTSRRKEG